MWLQNSPGHSGKVLRFQIIRNGFCREGVAHIVEGVLDHSFQLIDLPHLIVLDNMKN